MLGTDDVEKRSFPSGGEEMVVTDRSFSTVLEELSANAGYFRGKKVLSVGEGVSGFANGLSDGGIDITAVDPIYVKGDSLLASDAPREREALGENVVFKSYRAQNEEYSPPQKDRVKVVAASSDSLPFRDNEFDLIVANRLYEHFDMRQ